jgi:Cdc6-like AAA superfamily ATPase
VEVASVSLSLYVLQRDQVDHKSSDISGVPGTGKTATVHTVVKELKRMAENNVFVDS